MPILIETWILNRRESLRILKFYQASSFTYGMNWCLGGLGAGKKTSNFFFWHPSGEIFKRRGESERILNKRWFRNWFWIHSAVSNDKITLRFSKKKKKMIKINLFLSNSMLDLFQYSLKTRSSKRMAAKNTQQQQQKNRMKEGSCGICWEFPKSPKRKMQKNRNQKSKESLTTAENHTSTILEG